jgi:hypothetical protein
MSTLHSESRRRRVHRGKLRIQEVLVDHSPGHADNLRESAFSQVHAVTPGTGIGTAVVALYRCSRGRTKELPWASSALMCLSE